MKVMLLFPKWYSFYKTIEKAAEKNSCSIVTVDYHDFFPGWKNRLISKTSGLPRDFKRLFTKRYTDQINKAYLSRFRQEKPDLVIIYNNQLLGPETLKELKRKAKIVFYLGDNPLFSHTNDYNLALLHESDLIVCPDTYWIDQLQTIGINGLVFDLFGWDDDIYHSLEKADNSRTDYENDAVFIGRTYLNSWGYKRMMFLNGFKDFDICIYASGKGWDKWLDDFPALRNKIKPYNSYDPSFNNIKYNRSKIAPVDSNPGTFNGIHVRTLDALGAGTMPVIEFKKDYDEVFSGMDVFYVKKYCEIREVASYYINNEKTRNETVKLMRSRILDKFKPEKTFKRIIEEIKL